MRLQPGPGVGEAVDENLCVRLALECLAGRAHRFAVLQETGAAGEVLQKKERNVPGGQLPDLFRQNRRYERERHGRTLRRGTDTRVPYPGRGTQTGRTGDVAHWYSPCRVEGEARQQPRCSGRERRMYEVIRVEFRTELQAIPSPGIPPGPRPGPSRVPAAALPDAFSERVLEEGPLSAWILSLGNPFRALYG